MSEVKWIKIVTDIFDDEKILLIESMPERDAIIVLWFKLLCLAGKQNNGGIFLLNEKIAYTDEMLSVVFRRPINTVRLALQTFEQFGMIEIVNNTITIPKWEKHQDLDRIQKGREQTRKRVAAYRERLKIEEKANESHDSEQCNDDVTRYVTQVYENVTQIEREGEGERKREENIYAENPQKRKRFTPPTVEEVSAYCQERKNGVDAQRFVDYYSSNGWKVGKNAMKDWKAAVRTWERNAYGTNKAVKEETPYAGIDADCCW